MNPGLKHNTPGVGRGYVGSDIVWFKFTKLFCRFGLGWWCASWQIDKVYDFVLSMMLMFTLI